MPSLEGAISQTAIASSEYNRSSLLRYPPVFRSAFGKIMVFERTPTTVSVLEKCGKRKSYRIEITRDIVAASATFCRFN